MFKVLWLILSLASTVSFASETVNADCQPRLSYSNAGEIIKMRVQGHRVACERYDDMRRCLSVQKGASIGMESWEVLPQAIEGFSFEEGFTYDLIVRIDVLQDKTASERFKYTLVEIISKIKES